jgi:uncharacterized membrane-anchored protein
VFLRTYVKLNTDLGQRDHFLLLKKLSKFYFPHIRALGIIIVILKFIVCKFARLWVVIYAVYNYHSDSKINKSNTLVLILHIISSNRIYKQVYIAYNLIQKILYCIFSQYPLYFRQYIYCPSLRNVIYNFHTQLLYVNNK